MPGHLRHVVAGAVASALALTGLVAFATPAFAHDNLVSANASCASPLGTGYTIVWTIQNDFNAPETGSVTSVTGGLPTLSTTTYSVAASPGQPYSSTTLTQALPAAATGPITLDISSRWLDGFSTTDAASYNLSQLNCGAPEQTIAGHIYLCNAGAPTTTEQSGGTLATSGPTTLAATPNPLAPTQVNAGGYTMTATPPPGYTLVVCSGSSTPNSSGSTATEAVTVPSGGAGVGIFYVVATTAVVTNPTSATTPTSPGAPGPSSPSTPAAAASPAPVVSSTLAFTGAPLTSEWLIGLFTLLLGSALVLLGRRRRGPAEQGDTRFLRSAGPRQSWASVPIRLGTRSRTRRAYQLADVGHGHRESYRIATALSIEATTLANPAGCASFPLPSAPRSLFHRSRQRRRRLNGPRARV
jgi:hypothetical protein